jgi:hypothetical protein
MIIREKSNSQQMPLMGAVQWFKNGDHPFDDCLPVVGNDGSPFMGEGKVVRYFRHPHINGNSLCADCLKEYHDHGFIDLNFDNSAFLNEKFDLFSPKKKSKVCPSDWVVCHLDNDKDVDGKKTFFAISDKDLRKLFQVVEE